MIVSTATAAWLCLGNSALISPFGRILLSFFGSFFLDQSFGCYEPGPPSLWGFFSVRACFFFTRVFLLRTSMLFFFPAPPASLAPLDRRLFSFGRSTQPFFPWFRADSSPESGSGGTAVLFPCPAILVGRSLFSFHLPFFFFNLAFIPFVFFFERDVLLGCSPLGCTLFLPFSLQAPSAPYVFLMRPVNRLAFRASPYWAFRRLPLFEAVPRS